MGKKSTSPKSFTFFSSVDDHALHEECGVIGAISFSKQDVSPLLYRALIALQHRGQDAAGMAVGDSKSKKINLHKGLGLVTDVFEASSVSGLRGPLGGAHGGYPTIGPGHVEDAQPFLEDEPLGGVALAHNGNIANYGTVRAQFEKTGRVFCSTCDADLILAVLVKHLKAAKLDIFKAVSLSMDELDGSYSVCAITAAGELIVYRDPHAIRPLCWGKNEDFMMFASESTALDINDVPLLGDVGPGEALVISLEGKVQKKQLIPHPQKRHCMFEYVYFSRPDSIAQGQLIYDVRRELGRRLAKAAPASADIVVAVPDTSRPAAEGYSRASGIPIEEGLMKNRYVGRTFIMAGQSKRLEAVKLKLNAVRPLVAGKRIVLIDDSIVRGTTSGPILKLLRDAGAKEIHLRIACPPVISPCFYGVDLPTYHELVAANHSVEEICQMVGADSLAFSTIDDLVGAIGLGKDNLCLGCVNGKYPTQLGNDIAAMLKKHGSDPNVRVWEQAHPAKKK
ncbi:Glutamine--fructose-6-phosphate aminotransferase [isomerizing] [uncultured archaeon]|nr:Glutamine--fructose-6-phosphate aminotransferase [isomerizing] [uncultured archaeon]